MKITRQTYEGMIIAFTIGFMINLLTEWYFRSIDSPDINNLFHVITTALLIITLFYIIHIKTKKK